MLIVSACEMEHLAATTAAATMLFRLAKKAINSCLNSITEQQKQNTMPVCHFFATTGCKNPKSCTNSHDKCLVLSHLNSIVCKHLAFKGACTHARCGKSHSPAIISRFKQEYEAAGCPPRQPARSPIQHASVFEAVVLIVLCSLLILIAVFALFHQKSVVSTRNPKWSNLQPQPPTPKPMLAVSLPPPPPPSPPQHHNGYIYTTAHAHKVHDISQPRDGHRAVGPSDGFEVAPGDANDIEVANTYPWGCVHLVFSDGSWAGSSSRIALDPNLKGTLRACAKLALQMSGIKSHHEYR
jgi:hypothetical protein